MPENAQCSACGAEVAADAAPEGLCPACLLQAGLPVDPDDAPTVTASPSDRAVEHRVGSRLTPGASCKTLRVERFLCGVRSEQGHIT